MPPGFSQTFTWLDLDDDEELLGSLDVENLPSLAVYRSDSWVFWGSVEPIWPLIQTTSLMASASLDKDVEANLTKLLGRDA